MAEASTTASIVRLVPNFLVKYCAIALTEPVSSISLPNSPPSRNMGNHCAMNRAAPLINVCVQWASSGSPEKAAAMSAAIGETSRILHPRYASHMSRASPSSVPIVPMVSLLSYT